MDYVTFISRQQCWQLYRGVGTEGELIAGRRNVPQWHDLSAARQGFLWGCGQSQGGRALVQRLALPDLNPESLDWSGGRIGALTCSPDGQEAVVLELPSQTDQQQRLWLWNSHCWRVVESAIVPDISSKLAWLKARQIIFESSDRLLTVLDLATNKAEVGPPGCCPVVATEIEEWYAISNGQVFCFPFDQPFVRAPILFQGFDFGQVTGIRMAGDGQVCIWTEPRFLYQSKGYWQIRGRQRKRFPEFDDGIAVVCGPWDLGIGM